MASVRFTMARCTSLGRQTGRASLKPYHGCHKRKNEQEPFEREYGIRFPVSVCINGNCHENRSIHFVPDWFSFPRPALGVPSAGATWPSRTLLGFVMERSPSFYGNDDVQPESVSPNVLIVPGQNTHIIQEATAECVEVVGFKEIESVHSNTLGIVDFVNEDVVVIEERGTQRCAGSHELHRWEVGGILGRFVLDFIIKDEVVLNKSATGLHRVLGIDHGLGADVTVNTVFIVGAVDDAVFRGGVIFAAYIDCAHTVVLERVRQCDFKLVVLGIDTKSVPVR